MNKEQAVTYLKFSGFSEEQIKAIEGAFTCDKCVYSTSEGCQYDDITETIPPFETSDDAISRQAVLNAMYELCDTGETLKENPWRDNPHIDGVVEAIEELPPVAPQPRTGRWIKDGQGGRYKWMCSNCGTHHRALYDYCPSCGCKMEVEDAD